MQPLDKSGGGGLLRHREEEFVLHFFAYTLLLLPYCRYIFTLLGIHQYLVVASIFDTGIDNRILDLK